MIVSCLIRFLQHKHASHAWSQFLWDTACPLISVYAYPSSSYRDIILACSTMKPWAGITLNCILAYSLIAHPPRLWISESSIATCISLITVWVWFALLVLYRHHLPAILTGINIMLSQLLIIQDSYVAIPPAVHRPTPHTLAVLLSAALLGPFPAAWGWSPCSLHHDPKLTHAKATCTLYFWKISSVLKVCVY